MPGVTHAGHPCFAGRDLPARIRVIERNRIVFGKEYIPVSENYRQPFCDFLAAHSLMPGEEMNSRVIPCKS